MARQYEDDLTIEVGDEDISVTVTYCVHCKYIPASWESPAEHPEVEIVDLCHSENTDKKFEFNQVFNRRQFSNKEWEPTPGLIDYDSWVSGATEDAAIREEEDEANYLYDRYDD